MTRLTYDILWEAIMYTTTTDDQPRHNSIGRSLQLHLRVSVCIMCDYVQGHSRWSVRLPGRYGNEMTRATRALQATGR